MTETNLTWGTLTDYATGTGMRPATAREWRRSADAVAAGDPAGAFIDPADMGTVYVSGGPEAEITDEQIAALRDEAGAQGDTGMAA